MNCSPITTQSPVSPISPISPIQSTTEMCYVMDDSKYNAEVNRVFKKIGYQTGTKIADTLQGSIWGISKTADNSAQSETAILKVANRYLQKHSKAIVNGRTCNINENILSEQHVLKYLTEQKDCPASIVKYYWFFKTQADFYLLQENGGDCLFDFIKKGHQLIKNGNLDVHHWKTVCKVMFKQMVDCIHYIHSKNVCHFDVSLENFLINDVEVAIDMYSDHTWKIRFFTDDIKIKLCDFGLANIFAKSDNFSSNKWCGKPQYQSPEIVSKQKTFNAKKNDIFCLGMCLFLMVIGYAPWDKAEATDEVFIYVMNYSVGDLLKCWNCLDVVDHHIINLLDSMLKFEKHRVSLENIKNYVQQFTI